MKLAIADPPYLGRAARHYGPGASSVTEFGSGPARAARGWAPSHRGTTEHPDAAAWDDPATHVELIGQLCAEYDGWAVAMWPTSLPLYLAHAPVGARVCPWVKVRPVPGGSRVITSWEPVLVLIPPGRKARAPGMQVRDSLTADPARNGHVGAKPAEWTRWVLDLLGFDPAADTVSDLFPGSGAVSRAIAQGVLL